MTVSIIERLSTSLTDISLPKLYRDPLLNAGSKFLFDFCNTYSNPNADGPLTTASTFVNLIDGQPGATIMGGVGLTSLAGKKGIGFSGGQGATYLDFGTSYDLHLTSNEFIVIYWDKEPLTGFAGGSYVQGPTLTPSDGGHAQFYFDYGADNKTVRAIVGNAAGNYVAVQGASGQGQGAPRQIALHWKASGLLELYINGAIQGSSASAPTSLADVSTAHVMFANYYIGTFYRFYQEDLTVSGLSAGAQILADYTANSGRFS